MKGDLGDGIQSVPFSQSLSGIMHVEEVIERRIRGDRTDQLNSSF